VTGVRTVAGDSPEEASIEADFVVDASGRGSLLPDWIEALPGQTAWTVEDTFVDGATQYVSRWFRLEPNYAPEWHCLSIAPARDTDFRAAMMLRAEHDRWGVVLLAPAGDPLPADDEAFLEFTDGLAEGTLRAALDRAEPAGAIQHYGRAGNRLRHYDRLVDWPSGVVALGDSVCALDPYFGLGMTVAARGAVLLRKYLDREGSAIVCGSEFQRQLATTHVQPWRLATGCDTDGNPVPRDEDHLERLYGTARGNPEVANALLAVQHLLRPVETLFGVCPK
jgi:2-polyprenyl-6-methoxyphenol hydroxylase-like FAD-dependent oxidoreductase